MGDRQVTKRQEQALETKTRLYNAAIALMERKGFENITIAEISRAAGVSVGAFYHYFKSKNDLLAEIFFRADDYFSTQVAPNLIGKPAPELILEYFDHYAQFNIASGVEMVQQLFNPKIKFFVKEGRPMVLILQDLIRTGQERGEIRMDMSPEEAAWLLLTMARGVVFDWALRDGNYDLRAMMRVCIGRLVSTLTPRETSS